MISEISSKENPEPVPAATQLLGVTFLSGVDGYLRRHTAIDAQLRITLHRIMTRDSFSYLQQLCSYVSDAKPNPAKVGRLIPVTEGIVGRAYAKKSVVRTRFYQSEEALNADLDSDMRDTKDDSPRSAVAESYLAIPMLNKRGDVSTIFYGDAKIFNLFANDEIVKDIVAMCSGFCRTVDELVRSPISGFQNFPLEFGIPVKEMDTVYPRLQEVFLVDSLPRYSDVTSFNFENRL